MKSDRELHSFRPDWAYTPLEESRPLQGKNQNIDQTIDFPEWQSQNASHGTGRKAILWLRGVMAIAVGSLFHSGKVPAANSIADFSKVRRVIDMLPPIPFTCAVDYLDI